MDLLANACPCLPLSADRQAEPQAGRFRALLINTLRPGGGIGRHKGLKIPRLNGRDGSSPSPGTIIFEVVKNLRWFSTFGHAFCILNQLPRSIGNKGILSIA